MRIFAESDSANQTIFVAFIWAFRSQFLLTNYIQEKMNTPSALSRRQNSAIPASAGLPQLPQSFPQGKAPAEPALFIHHRVT